MTRMNLRFEFTFGDESFGVRKEMKEALLQRVIWEKKVIKLIFIRGKRKGSTGIISFLG